ncbi:hypothetical protein [Neobacillus sp. YIM B06451]|uniref:hypothetical protein n=1 Tax=Neobacillus sp. YIM B06451 TaxID=3070994 RepID=UPI00292D4B9D|nr:hypothetical protein [Neobacillus sp. YIM B06451]
MKDKEQMLSRRDLDEAFHNLHDQIIRIAVEEEEEMIKQEVDEKQNHEEAPRLD